MSMRTALSRCLPPALRASAKDWLPPVLFRLLRRLLVGPAPDGAPIAAPAPAAGPALPNVAGVDVVEVDRAGLLAGELFARRFNAHEVPNEQHHFVAIASSGDNALRVLGYVHYTMWNGCALCGGLVIDERAFRRLPERLREDIRAVGGIAELLLRTSFERLPGDTVAIWGHVGNKQSEKVCLRAGFVRTEDKYLMVVWRSAALSEADRKQWVARAKAIGPF